MEDHYVIVGAGGAIGSELCSCIRAAGEKSVAIGHRIETLANLETDYRIQADVTREDHAIWMFQEIAELGFFPKAVINLVGIHHIQNIEDISLDDWNLVFATNVRSAFLTTKWAVRQFYSKPEYRERTKTIVNLASKAATRPMRCSSPYNSSKAAMRMLSFQAARELSKYKVSVVCISPGIIGDVPMSFSVMDDVCSLRGWTKEHALNYQLEHIPWGEMVTTKEVASAIMYACSPIARTMTGSEIQITGGQY